MPKKFPEKPQGRYAAEFSRKIAGGQYQIVKKWAEVGGRKRGVKTPAHRTYTKIITPSTDKKFGLRKINIKITPISVIPPDFVLIFAETAHN